jgi:hypothetical protein
VLGCGAETSVWQAFSESEAPLSIHLVEDAEMLITAPFSFRDHLYRPDAAKRSSGLIDVQYLLFSPAASFV